MQAFSEFCTALQNTISHSYCCVDQLFTDLLSFDKFNFTNLFPLAFLFAVFPLTLFPPVYFFSSGLLKCINFLRRKLP